MATRPAARPPNLIVIMVDQLRATALGLYGNPQVRTPHLERLAAEGALFRWAFTPSPVCVPARVSFWTGRWPHLTGSRDNRVYLQPGETHLIQLLRDAGYRTGLIGKNHCFPEADLACSFDTYYPVGHGGPAEDGGDATIAAARDWVRHMEVGGPGDVRRAGAGDGAAYAAGISPHPVEKHGSWLIGEHADAFLRANRDQPFCAWVSLPDPHTPYQVSLPYASRYPPESIQLPPAEPSGYPSKPEEFQMFAELMAAAQVPDEHLRFVLSVYYGMIAVIDDVVGRLLATLDELGLREETIVVFTSDHGDYMTEHRLVRKGASMYDCLTRVPLLVSWPGTIGRGQVSENLVSTLDVFSTLTHLMALPTPPGRNGQPLPVTPALAGAAPPRRFIVSEHGTPREALTREKVQQRLAAMAAAGRPHRLPFQLVASGPKKMVRTHEWKYVYRAGGEDELYDLRADPHELANLAGVPEQRDRIEALRRNLLDWMTETEEDDVSPIAGGDVSMRGERPAG